MATDKFDNGEENTGLRAPLGWWQRTTEFFAEVRNEMKRVTWPTQKEVYATTVVVILDVGLLRPVPVWRRPGAERGRAANLHSASVPHDRGDREELVHRPHLLGLREEGRRVAAAARAGVRAAGRNWRGAHPDRGCRGNARGQESGVLEALLPRLHPGRDEHDRQRVACRQEHAEGHRVRRGGRQADAADQG